MDINPQSGWHNAEFVNTTGGYFPARDRIDRKVLPLEPWDTTRRDLIILTLRTILERQVNGDLVELGVYRGLSARLIHHYAPDRMLHLFDTFEGFGQHDLDIERVKTGVAATRLQFSDTNVDLAQKCIAPVNSNVSFYKGIFPETIPATFSDKCFAFVHIDLDLYEPIYKALAYFYPRVTRGGVILVHDYNAWLGARRAVDEFFHDLDEYPFPMPDKSGSALIVKTRK